MIVIESKKRKLENIRKEYPNAVIHDVTSHATDEFVRMSPFYPHGGIPVPFSPGYTACSVESIWQGLKDYESSGIDTTVFHNATMQNLKRTKRKFGNVIGHRKGVNGTEHFGYIDARVNIYLPTYRWILEHRVQDLVEILKKEAEDSIVVLLDYDTNPDVYDRTSPLSHASLIKKYIEGNYPQTEESSSTSGPSQFTCMFKSSEIVEHPKFGQGKVLDVNADSGKISVDFESVGTKTLILALAHLTKKE